jgi:hypothetical protein
MGSGRTSSHRELAHAWCSWILGTRLSIHRRSAIDMRCHVLVESGVGAQAGIGVIKPEEGIHLTHYFNNLELVTR